MDIFNIFVKGMWDNQQLFRFCLGRKIRRFCYIQFNVVRKYQYMAHLNFLARFETELECIVRPHSRKLLPTSLGTRAVGTYLNFFESFLNKECSGSPILGSFESFYSSFARSIWLLLNVGIPRLCLVIWVWSWPSKTWTISRHYWRSHYFTGFFFIPRISNKN